MINTLEGSSAGASKTRLFSVVIELIPNGAALWISIQDLDADEWKVCVAAILKPLVPSDATAEMAKYKLASCTKYMIIVEEDKEDE